jgi:hypothetical protein
MQRQVIIKVQEDIRMNDIAKKILNEIGINDETIKLAGKIYELKNKDKNIETIMTKIHSPPMQKNIY